MSDLTIQREIVIDAPTEIVWRTITEPDQIAQWFADRVELDLRPGGNGTFVFEDRATAQATTAPIVVETVEAPHRFTFRWGHSEGEPANVGNSVRVEFTLSAESGERTRLRVVETGLDDVEWPDDEKARYAEDHRHGWSVHVGRLGDLLGTPTG
ncbi:MAG TPA: SRPBCC domain-containing protein [Acidimicrobiales bacterium]|jgi:uncharacterized protein YndB with AHSA1/START domain